MRHWSSALVLGVAGASFACARTQSAPVSLTAAEVTSGEAHPTFAPAGEQFTIQMNTLLNSATTEAGKLFSAEVVSPVLAQDGTVLVPVERNIVGYVDEIDSGNVARIGLAFDKVETTRGPAPLAVKVLSAQNYLVGGKSESHCLVWWWERGAPDGTANHHPFARPSRRGPHTSDRPRRSVTPLVPWGAESRRRGLRAKIITRARSPLPPS